MSYNHIAELVCWNPAQRYGVLNKGDIALGFDADLVLIDPNESFIVNSSESESTQGYSVFEGMKLTGKVKTTFLRGNLIYANDKIVGEAKGKFVRRPTV